MAENTFEGIEIPEELLEGVAGGALSKSRQKTLDNVIKAFKKMGRSKESLCKVFSATDDEKVRADALAYIERNW